MGLSHVMLTKRATKSKKNPPATLCAFDAVLISETELSHCGKQDVSDRQDLC